MTRQEAEAVAFVSPISDDCQDIRVLAHAALAQCYRIREILAEINRPIPAPVPGRTGE